MKKLFIIPLFLITISTLFAQNNYEILEQNVLYNHFDTSFTPNVIGANEDFVIYHWQKFIEQHKGTTYLVSSGEGDVEFESEHVQFPWLNNEIIILHSRFTPSDTETEMLLTI